MTRWIAPGGAAALGALAVAVALLLPAATLEDLVWQSGIAALLPVAEPPLGTTARAVLALGGGVLTVAVTWSALFLLVGPGGFFAAAAVTRSNDGLPVLRKADAHPDAPVRRPMSARDLGAPMPPVASSITVPPVRPLPADLDQPLAAFDPAALPEVPREPVRAVAALRPPMALVPGERIATVELPRTPATDAGAPSIEALLWRLEQGTRRRAGAGGR